MTANNLRGVITALITPFKNGEVDKKSFVQLVQQQMRQGIDGFVINGTTGESPSLRLAEVRTLFQLARTETGGNIPLIVGTGSNSTARTCELSQEVCKWRPDALLLVVPYYNRPPQRGLSEHFRQVAHAANVPVLLYNVPSRTVAGLELATVVELSREKNIIGIKEATGDLALCAALKRSTRPGFTLLSGDDASCVDFCKAGGQGVISVSSHIIGAEMRAALEQPDGASYQRKYGELFKWLYIEANPIPVKMALYWMGVIESPELRLPLVPLEEKFHKEFQACLKKLEKMH